MSIPSWAHAGAKIVCVDMSMPPTFDRGEQFPVEGVAYTIRETTISELGNAMVRLKEIVNPPLDYVLSAGPINCECWFGLHRFRPLVTKTAEEDSAMFHRLIDDIPSSITERLDMIREMLG